MHSGSGRGSTGPQRRGRRRAVLFPTGFVVLAGIAGTIVAALFGLAAPAAASGVAVITSTSVLLVELYAEQGFRWYRPRWPVR
ncbi:hypothetical protein [Amycolatopsis taiwanensis]|uniref:Uncharacterized protein n=1 Tax=Amycolatopsis taiwanensis TaxID=342230 RepID=A0A9W6QYS5_9PSEU|nr:hypothetical protein [Amycolatopsis taiwanensis]GLY66491.1 hypothetical protein Atai01_31100 [Amycolatopsis taiwanensis]